MEYKAEGYMKSIAKNYYKEAAIYSLLLGLCYATNFVREHFCNSFFKYISALFPSQKYFQSNSLALEIAIAIDPAIATVFSRFFHRAYTRDKGNLSRGSDRSTRPHHTWQLPKVTAARASEARMGDNTTPHTVGCWKRQPAASRPSAGQCEL